MDDGTRMIGEGTREDTSSDTRGVLRFVSIGFGAIAALWIGVNLINLVFARIAPLVLSAGSGAIEAVLKFLVFAIEACLVLLFGLFVLAAPLAAAVGCVWAFAALARVVTGEIGRLRTSLSDKGRKTAGTAGFLLLLGVMAALVFYGATGDIIGQEDAIIIVRVLATASALCALCKILALIPVRAIKALALFGMLVVAVGTAGFVNHRYAIIGRAGASLAGLRDSVGESTPLVVFAVVVAGILLAVALLHPFTPRAWLRQWRVG